MLQVIPAILAKDFDGLKKKLAQVAPFCEWAQIDVADGVFAPNVTWNNPEEIRHLAGSISLEIHLMIDNAPLYFNAWIGSGAKRVIVPADSASDAESMRAMAEKAKARGVGFGIALNPEVAVPAVEKILPLAEVVLVLAVNPGFSGQEFQPAALDKVKDLRKRFPGVKIEVDGGITPETAKLCAAAGADMVVSGSYLFRADNMQKAIASLAHA